MANEGMMISYEGSRDLLSRMMCGSSRSFSNNQIGKRVEAALYEYPMWKVNSEQLQPHHKENVVELRNSVENNSNPAEGLGVRRIDYVSYINLIEATLTVLSPLQRDFVRQRYFKKNPFKIIAEELAVTERHLYRIRQEVIRLVGVSFGWL